MNSYGQKRDACEKEIIKALKGAGAYVQQLTGKGVPDLLVGYRGRTYLMECKDPVDGARNSRSSAKKVKNPLGLRDSQWEWWQAWRGERPIIVTTPSEALAALAEPRMVADGVFVTSDEEPITGLTMASYEAHTIRGRLPK